MKRTSVTKEQFDEFLAKYPRPLQRDIYRVSTPEQVQYNDFSLGAWPESIVASHDAWGHTLNDPWGPEPGDWRVNHEATKS